MMYSYRCGTCGTLGMVITCRAGQWSMRCVNGHPFIYAGEDIEIRIDADLDEPDSDWDPEGDPARLFVLGDDRP